MRTCGQSWSRQQALLSPLLGCLTFVLLLTARYSVCGQTLCGVT